jgi:hypothetical protein
MLQILLACISSVWHRMYFYIGHLRVGGQLEPGDQPSSRGARCWFSVWVTRYAIPVKGWSVVGTYDGIDWVIGEIDVNQGDIP